MGNSIVEDKMKNDEWLKTQEEKYHEYRLSYIKSFNKPLSHLCPECSGELTTSEDEDEIICTKCGLVTSASISYVAGIKINLPYGINLYNKK